MPNLQECASGSFAKFVTLLPNLNMALSIWHALLERLGIYCRLHSNAWLKQTWVFTELHRDPRPAACIFSSLCCVTEAFLNVGDPGEIKSIVESHAHVVKYQGFELASHQLKRDSTEKPSFMLAASLNGMFTNREQRILRAVLSKSCVYMLQMMLPVSFTCINPVCEGRPAWSPGWCIQTPGGAQSPAPPWRWRTADSRWLSKHEWSTCPVGGSRIVVLAWTSWGTCLRVRCNTHQLCNVKVPFYEGAPPARSVPRCGPPCPPGAQRCGLARSYPPEAAVFAETGLVGQCARSRSRPDTQWTASQ